jgi:cation transport ATPase
LIRVCIFTNANRAKKYYNQRQETVACFVRMVPFDVHHNNYKHINLKSKMNKTIYNISKMDCASEEQMIRMKLEDISTISSLSFDIPMRTLEVVHSGTQDDIFNALDSLKFDTKLISTEAFDTLEKSNHHAPERTLLYQVLAINAFFLLLELTTGIIAQSMGLVADSLDMLADSIVYGLSLFAVGSTMHLKKRVATISGYFQFSLAMLGLVEVIRRFIGIEEVPSFQLMIGISAFALLGNAASLYLLQKSKSNEAHMQASMIFTSNDVIVNIGVIVAGVLVLLTNSNYPDLIVGIVIFGIVSRGAFRILKLGKGS